MRCWHGYLPGARHKWFSNGPADATAPRHLLLHYTVALPFEVRTQVGPRKHALDGVHIGATWRIRLNRPCAAAVSMRPFLWNYFGHLIVVRTISGTIERGRDSRESPVFPSCTRRDVSQVYVHRRERHRRRQDDSGPFRKWVYFTTYFYGPVCTIVSGLVDLLS